MVGAGVQFGDVHGIDPGRLERIAESRAQGSFERGVSAGKKGEAAVAELEKALGDGAGRFLEAEIDLRARQQRGQREEERNLAFAQDLEIVLGHSLRHDDDAAQMTRQVGPPCLRFLAEQNDGSAERRHVGLGAANHFHHGPKLPQMAAFDEEADVPMHVLGAAVGECAFAVFAIDQAPVLEISQRKPHGDAADLKTAAELMFAFDDERRRIVSLKDFLRESGNQTGTSRR